MDVPAFEHWPQADFPKMKYPFEKHRAENEAEEKRCLELVCVYFTLLSLESIPSDD
jgi:4-aminobutyrate aminotransferase/(S)-3-amino-2-methylpropionate transaminase